MTKKRTKERMSMPAVTNPVPPSYEELLAELTKKKEAAKTARAERDVKELQEFAHLLDDENHILVRFPDSRPDLPGHVVCRLPNQPQMARWRAVVHRDPKERGAAEAKQKNGADLARNCVIWPTMDRYEALVDAYPFVPDCVAGELIQAVQAGHELKGKG